MYHDPKKRTVVKCPNCGRKQNSYIKGEILKCLFCRVNYNQKGQIIRTRIA